LSFQPTKRKPKYALSVPSAMAMLFWNNFLPITVVKENKITNPIRTKKYMHKSFLDPYS
jgi:hypothetical protein